LKDPIVLDVFYQMVEKADIVVENYRPGVTKRLGIDYDTVHKLNPRAIYLSFSAYGQDDPRSQKPLHDINLVAESGYFDLNGGHVPPMPPCDMACVSVGLQSLLTALYARERTGEGCHLDMAMADSFTWFNTILDARWFFFGERMDNTGCEYPAVGYNVYETKDGRRVAFGFYEDKFWEAFLTDVDRLDLVGTNKTHIENNPQAAAEVAALVKTKTADEWMRWLEDKSYGFSLCLDKTEAVTQMVENHPEMQDFVEYPRFGRVLQTNEPHRIGDYRPDLHAAKEPPLLGEHTTLVLEELGVNPEIIDDLIARGSVKVSE
jgi:crotonobetainyl-CoA:carnitine CoA-transferase CaiB-like acyl-CoA transferase